MSDALLSRARVAEPVGETDPESRPELPPMERAAAPRLAVIGSVVCLLGWAIPAALMADRGLSLADEGLYLLSYRRWAESPYFFSGSQYIYGPLFDLLQQDVRLLRLFRLVAGLFVYGSFAWTFTRWLQLHRGPDFARWAPALTIALTACGGLSYLWTPLTPGYYNLTAWCAIGLVSLVLATASRVAQHRAVPHWHGLLTGVLTVVLAFTKWPAIVLPVACLGAALWLIRDRGLRPVAGLLGAVAAGAFLAVTSLELIGVDVADSMAIVLRMSAASDGHAPMHVLSTYALEAWHRAPMVLSLAFPLLVLVLAGHVVRSDAALLIWRGTMITAAVVVTVLSTFVLHVWHGGKETAHEAVAAVLALLLVGFLAARSGLRRRGEPQPSGASSGDTAPQHERVIVGLLIVVPALQTAGHVGALFYVALEALPLWVAMLGIFATRDFTRPHLRPVVYASIIGLAVLSASIGGTGSLLDPFDTDPYSRNTVAVPQSGGLKVSPVKAQEYAELREALRPYLGESPAPILALDEMAGLVYLLGGVALGPTWTDDGGQKETPKALAMACADGHVDPTRPPILLVNRAIDRATAETLVDCGFAFPARFRELAVEGGPDKVTVFVPVDG